MQQRGDFCLGDFSGDTCLTWSEYSARPTFVDHSTTLIFTPGDYSLRNGRGTFSVANIKRFTMIGDRANLQFRVSFSNIGYVSIKNLTFFGSIQIDVSNIQSFVMENCALTNNVTTYSDSFYPRINVRNVQTFTIERCTLTRVFGSTSRYTTSSATVYLYRSNMNRIIDSTFVSVTIFAQSGSALFVSQSRFSNSRVRCIRGESSSSVTIHNSSFVNNYITSGVVYTSTQTSLTIVDCLFYRNSGYRTVYSSGDVTVTNSNFINNEAPYNAIDVYNTYRGGYAIQGLKNIHVHNCTFTNYTKTSSVIYSYSYNSRSYRPVTYILEIMNSQFHHSNRSIYSYNNNVTVYNSSFYNITAFSGEGGTVYSRKSLTMMNCSLINSVAISGSGGALYSQQSITVHNSTIINTMCSTRGGAVYSTKNVTVINSAIVNSASESQSGGAIHGLNVRIVDSTIGNSTAHMDGGAVYSLQNVIIINSTLSHCLAQGGKGGAVYSAANDVFNGHSTELNNVILSRSTFNHNFAISGGVLYTTGHYNHRMEFNDSTFVFNEATGDSSEGGGVAFIRNTSLSISNCVFNKNIAGSDGGVLDITYSSVNIQQSSLSYNRADNNGGVLYGRNYSTNFTIEQAVFEHNTATNGGVFYVRRFNSNIKLAQATFIENHATNQGGIMDIRGVTLEVDRDSFIANNTANNSSDVISACLSHVTTYGLVVLPDSIYPMYCSLYQVGNSSQANATSVTEEASTDLSTTQRWATTSQPTESDQANTFTQATNNDQDVTTLHSGAMTTASIPMSSRATIPLISTTTSTHSEEDIKTSAVHTSAAASTSDIHTSTTTSSVTDATEVLTWTDRGNGATTGFGRIPSQMTSTSSEEYDMVSTGSRLQPKTDLVTTDNNNIIEKVTEVTSQASSTNKPLTTWTSSELTTTSTDDESQSTTTEYTESEIIKHQDDSKTTGEIVETVDFKESETTTATEPLTSISDRRGTTSPQLSGVQADQDKLNSSEHDIFQVALVSLTVLCIICILTFIMMAVLFFLACKRRNITLRPRGQYKKLQLTTKEEDEAHNEVQEYSFVEI